MTPKPRVTINNLISQIVMDEFPPEQFSPHVREKAERACRYAIREFLRDIASTMGAEIGVIG